MILEGKTVIITSNSSVFLKITKKFIENSGKPRSEFFIVAENGLLFKESFQRRINKVGILTTIDEWFYTKYEAVFNNWAKAESKLLYDIDISFLKPDLTIIMVLKNVNNVLMHLKNYNANNILSIGSGYIPKCVLDLFNKKINIHPGVLPFYKGLGTPEAILKQDYLNLGWSLHELSPKIDSGRIIHISKIRIESFKKRTIAEIYIYIYLMAINDFFLFSFNDYYSEENSSYPNSSYSKNNYSFMKITVFIKYLIKSNLFDKFGFKLKKKKYC